MSEKRQTPNSYLTSGNSRRVYPNLYDKKSMSIVVTYNRKNMESIGSLSPELLQKLESRQKNKEESDIYSGDQSKRGGSQRIKQKGGQNQTSARVEKPSPYVTRESMHDLLHAEPVKTRLDSLNKHKLEFMQYLRPILVDDTNPGEGWEFLTTHVMENRNMFNSITEERRERARIKREVEQCQTYIQ